MSIIYAVCLAALSVLSFLWARRSVGPRASGPLALFCGVYFATSQAGAIIIGLCGLDHLEAVKWGLDLSTLRQIGGFKYWTLLFAPTTIPCLMVALWKRKPKVAYAPLRSRVSGPDRVDAVPLTLWFAALAGFCLFEFYAGGFWRTAFSLFQNRGDFFWLMSLRSQMFETLPSSLYRLVYTGLPVLSFCALYQSAQTRRLIWRVLFVGMFSTVCYLNLCTVQKAMLLVYFVALGIGLYELGRLKLKVLVFQFCTAFCLLTGLQYFYLPEWSFQQSLEQIVFRVAQSFPYYLNVYPDHVPYLGIDLGQHLFGVGFSPNDNAVVFNFMYPSITWIQGAAAAPAHARAYAQAGEGFSLLTVVIIGWALLRIDAFHRRVRGPLTFALYLQMLVFLYHLNQVSLVDAVLSSYGLLWAVVALAPMFAWGVWRNRSPKTDNLLLRLPSPAATRGRKEPQVA